MPGMSTKTAEPVVSEVARAIELSGGPAVVARALQVTTQTVCFYRDGKRRINAEHAAVLESISGGRVTRKDMWPSRWARIWPELSDSPANAPQPPATEAAGQGVA